MQPVRRKTPGQGCPDNSAVSSGVRPLLLLGALFASGCALNPRPTVPSRNAADPRAIVRVLDRITFGATAADLDRVQAIGVQAFIDEQLNPQRLSDDRLEARLKDLRALTISTRQFATDYYHPMVVARQEFSRALQGVAGPGRSLLRWHLLPIAAMSLPGGPRSVSPMNIVQQPPVTPEESR